MIAVIPKPMFSRLGKKDHHGSTEVRSACSPDGHSNGRNGGEVGGFVEDRDAHGKGGDEFTYGGSRSETGTTWGKKWKSCS